MDSGSYILLVRVTKRSVIRVGRLGEVEFRRGWYIYVGSAMRGLRARIARHQRTHKKFHWHIDYLLAHPNAQLRAVRAFPSPDKQECDLYRAVCELPGAQAGLRGFGASDCSERCGAHLAFFGRKPDLGKLPF